MRTFLSVLVVCAVVLAAGCASSGASGLAARPTPSIQEDAAYVAAVEQVARRRGVSVRWVNPPLARDEQP